MHNLRLLFRLSRPPNLLLGAVMYFLGAGVARYLGISIDSFLYLLGQSWLVLVQVMVHSLNEYFESPVEHNHPGKNLLLGTTGVLDVGKLARPVALWSSVGCGLAASLMTVLILQNVSDPWIILVVLLLIIFSGLVYSVPPMRLSFTPYRELALSFIIVGLVPVLAFTIQGGGYHRLMAMVIFPLICIFLGLLLVTEFPDYSASVKYLLPNLLIALGWQQSMTLHNLLIAGGFLFFGLALLFGFPITIFLPLLAVFPIGILQIWTLNRIRLGIKPNWSLMLLLAYATFGLTTYFLAYGFWTH